MTTRVSAHCATAVCSLWSQALRKAKRGRIASSVPEIPADLRNYPVLVSQLRSMIWQPDATSELRNLGESVLYPDRLGCPVNLRKITETFQQLVGRIPDWWSWRGGEGFNAELEDVNAVRLDEDARLRRYAEMWCRFVLILAGPYFVRSQTIGLRWRNIGVTKPTNGDQFQDETLVNKLVSKVSRGHDEVRLHLTPEELKGVLEAKSVKVDHFVWISPAHAFFKPVEEPKAVNVIRLLMTSVNLEEALKRHLCKLERIGKAARLIALIEAMHTWISRGSRKFFEDLLIELDDFHANGSMPSMELKDVRLMLHPELADYRKLRNTVARRAHKLNQADMDNVGKMIQQLRDNVPQ
eukprot:750877-Prymnesium_polylepis.1